MSESKIKIVPVEWSGASVAVNSGASPPEHLLMHERDAVFYGDASTDENGPPALVITVSWSAPVALDVLVIDRHNLSGNATIQHELIADGVVVYDSTSSAGALILPGEWLPGIHKFWQTYDDELPAKSAAHYMNEMIYADQWRITINDPANAAGQIQIGRLPVGRSLKLINNFSWNADLTLHDSAQLHRTGGGGLDIETGDQYRSLAIDLDWLEAPDRTLILTELARQKSRLLYVSAYPQQSNVSAESLMSQFLAVRENNVSVARSNALFGKTSINFMEA